MSKWTKIDEKYFKNGRNQVEKVPKFDETWIQNIYRNDPKVSIKLIKIGLEINQKPINKRSKIISKTEYNEEIFVHIVLLRIDPFTQKCNFINSSQAHDSSFSTSKFHSFFGGRFDLFLSLFT